MEQQTQQTQSPASPCPVSTPRGFERCRARNRDRSQCRLHVQNPATGLCSRHAAQAGNSTDTLQDTVDLSAEIFDAQQPVLETAEDINAVISNIVILVAKGRISPRRAAVISYALSLILRSVVILDRKAAPSNHLGRYPPRPQRGRTRGQHTTQRRSRRRSPRGG